MTDLAPRDSAGHPASGLSDIVHQRTRLGILAIVHEAPRVEFSYLRASLELSAGNLSQHLGVLANAGLITLEKGYAGKRARTWVTITKAGRAALADEITQLKLLIGRIDSTSPPLDQPPRRPSEPGPNQQPPAWNANPAADKRDI